MDSESQITESFELWTSYLAFGISWKMDKTPFAETASFRSNHSEHAVELSRQTVEVFFASFSLSACLFTETEVQKTLNSTGKISDSS